MLAFLLALTAQPIPLTTGADTPVLPEARQADRFGSVAPEGLSEPSTVDDTDNILPGLEPHPEAWRADALALLEPYRGQRLSLLVDEIHRSDEMVRHPDRTLHVWRETASVAGGQVGMPGQGDRTIGYTVHCQLVVEVNEAEVITRFGISGAERACNRILRWLR